MSVFSQNITTQTGNIVSITGSLQGTASWAYQVVTGSISASYAETASYIDVTGSGVLVNWNGSTLQLTGSAEAGVGFPYTGSATISGSLSIEGPVESFKNLATGIGSLANGLTVSASGIYSHAEGNNTKALGSYTHAEGELTTAIGTVSHTEGRQTTAVGQYSHAEGQTTLAQGQTSHAEGFQTTALGNNSHTEGFGTTAVGTQSHAEGENTKAIGFGAHSEGTQTTAIGQSSHTEGQSTTASGLGSHAEGFTTRATGQYSHTEGFNTRATGQYSHAEGTNTQADGIASHAEGNSSTAKADYSFAHGDWVVTNKSGQFAIGQYNDSSSLASFIIGDGLDDNNRHNVVTVFPSSNGTLDDGRVQITGQLEAIGITGSLQGTASNAISVVTISDTAPTSGPLSTGSLWFNSTNATLNVRYQDVDGGQWVGVTSNGAVASGYSMTKALSNVTGSATNWSASYTANGGTVVVTAYITGFSSAAVSRSGSLVRNGTIIPNSEMNFFFNQINTRVALPPMIAIIPNETGTNTYSFALSGINADGNDRCTMTITEYK